MFIYNEQIKILNKNKFLLFIVFIKNRNIMNNKQKTALDTFIENNPETIHTNKDSKNKKVILDQREGLIERVDKQFITNDGRMLLREQY